MRLKILIVLFSVMFLFGCVQEGIRVVSVTNGSVPSAPAASPATSNTSSNSSAPSASNTSNTSAPKAVQTGADLLISTFYLSMIHLTPGENFEVTFKIANNGTETINNFEYLLAIKSGNDVVKSVRENLSLGSGASTSKIIKTFSLDTGTYSVVLSLDPSNAFGEANENNNQKSQNIDVRYPSVSNSSKVNNETTHSSSSSNSSSSGGCIDSDNGLTYNVAGTCKDTFGNDVSDICIEVNQIWEWSCVNSRCMPTTRTCYCQEGKCIG